MKIITTNRKAFFDYFILETYEAGIALFGSEVKAIREGRINLKDSFVKFKENEAILVNTHISNYSRASNIETVDPTRSRKLLLHRREIEKIRGKVEKKGFSVVPVEAYFNDRNIFKIKIALVQGKKNFDKKQVIKERDIKIQMQKDIKSYKK